MKYPVSKKRKELYHLTYTLYDYYYMTDKSIDKKKWFSIIADFFTLYIEYILKERKVLALPGRNGIIRPAKRKTNKTKNHLRLNFKAKKETGKDVYHYNLHSSGYYFRWIWDKSNIISNHKKHYKFEPHVFLKKSLSNEIIKCSKDPYLKDFDALS